jgi:alpha-aminoadipate carrier protein LysW
MTGSCILPPRPNTANAEILAIGIGTHPVLRIKVHPVLKRLAQEVLNSMVSCPKCDSAIDVEEEELDEGDVLSCDECGAALTVASLNPVEIKPEEEADEDDEEDDFDEDEDDDDDEDEEEDDEEEEEWQ